MEKTVNIEMNEKVVHSLIHALSHLDENHMTEAQKEIYNKLLEADEFFDEKTWHTFKDFKIVV